MATIEILFQMRQEGSGAQNVIRQLEGVGNQLRILRKEGGLGQFLGSGAISDVSIDPGQFDQYIEGLTNLAKGMELASAEALLLDKNLSQALDLKSQASSIRSAVSEIEKLKKAFTLDPQTVSGFVQAMSSAVNFDATSALAGVENAKNKTQAYIDVLNKLSAAYERAGKDAIEFDGDVGKGNALLESRREIDAYTKNLQQMTGTQNKGKKSTDILSGGFKSLGFEIFLLKNTFDTFAQIAKGTFETLEEGAQVLDKFSGFQSSLEQVGIVPEDLDARLRAASDGLIEMSDAYAGVQKLVVAGLPEIAANSDELLNLAVNAGKVKGDLTDIPRIYAKLIEGVVKANPKLIDETGIVLKLDEVYKKFGESLGKSGDELNLQEQKLATYFALLEEGERLQEIADANDNLSESYQKTRVELSEAADAGKAFLAEFITPATQSLGGVRDAFLELAKQALVSSGASEETASDWIESISSIKNFTVTALAGILGVWTGFQVVFDQTVGDGIRAVTDLVIDEVNAVSAAFNAIKEGDLTGAAAALSGVSAGAIDFAGALKEVTLSEEEEKMAMDAASERALGFAQAFGIASEASDELDNSLDTTVDGLREAAIATQTAIDQIDALIEAIGGDNLDLERNDRIKDANDELQDALEKARENFQERILNIERDTTDKLEDLLEDRNERLLRIDEDLANERADIQQDLEDKLSDIAQDADDKRNDAVEDSNKKKRKIEEDHQDKLRKILEKYELARTKALIDRDARALFEAQLDRDRAIRDLTQETQDAQDEEVSRLQERLDEISRLEERRIREAQQAAERRRRDAELAAEREREDERKQYERRREDELEREKERKEEAIKRYNQEKEDATEAFEDRLEQIDDWYRERLRKQKEAALIERLEEMQQYIESEGLLDDHIQQLQSIWQEYVDYLTELQLPVPQQPDIPGLPGTGGNGGNTPPTTPTTPQDSGVPAAGAPCNRPSGVGYPDANGDIFFCVNGVWKSQDEVFPPTTSTPPRDNGGNGGGRGSPRSLTGGAQQRVTLVTKDGLLQEMLNNIVSDVIIEVVS